LITGGSLLNLGHVKNDIQGFFPDTDTRIDDYLQYAPVCAMYLFDMSGIEHKNNVLVQTAYYIIARTGTGVAVNFLKRKTAIQRPVGGNTSFPSGHTAKAFVGASMLYHEFRETEPLIAFGGYAIATATGVLRITNDAHWLPDVLAGAGIGMVITNLVYFVDPLKNWNPFPNGKNISVYSGISEEGLSLTIVF
jgi:membrane-associated phospholipid phosphatase